MKTTRGSESAWVWILGVLLAGPLAPRAWAQPPAPAGFPPPVRVTVADDKKDLAGAQLMVKWQPPPVAGRPAGYQVAGYIIEAGLPAKNQPPEPAEALKGMKETQTVVGDLKVGQK